MLKRKKWAPPKGKKKQSKGSMGGLLNSQCNARTHTMNKLDTNCDQKRPKRKRGNFRGAADVQFAAKKRTAIPFLGKHASQQRLRTQKKTKASRKKPSKSLRNYALETSMPLSIIAESKAYFAGLTV